MIKDLAVRKIDQSCETCGDGNIIVAEPEEGLRA